MLALSGINEVESKHFQTSMAKHHDIMSWAESAKEIASTDFQMKPRDSLQTVKIWQ